MIANSKERIVKFTNFNSYSDLAVKLYELINRASLKGFITIGEACAITGDLYSKVVGLPPDKIYVGWLFYEFVETMSVDFYPNNRSIKISKYPDTINATKIKPVFCASTFAPIFDERYANGWFDSLCERPIFSGDKIDATSTIRVKKADFDPVQNPHHYCQGRKYEAREVIEDWGLDYYLGNVVKYISRAGRKGSNNEDTIKDLNKAIQCIKFEIEKVENGGQNKND